MKELLPFDILHHDPPFVIVLTTNETNDNAFNLPAGVEHFRHVSITFFVNT